MIAITGGENLLDMSPIGIDPIQLPPMPDKPPTGTKEYFFNSEAGFSTVQMLKTECVFKCYAINDKNAIKKFNKFKNAK